MKTILRRSLLWSVLLALLLSALPAAALYDWQDGTLPEGWTHITDESEVTATDILAPVNPHASREAKNLYAYLASLTDSQTFLTGQFDVQNTDDIWRRTVEQLGVEPALYSCRYMVDTSKPAFDTAEGTGITGTTMSFTDAATVNRLLLKHYEKGNVLLVHADSAPPEICGALLVEKGKYTDHTDAIMELDATNPERDMQAYALWRKYQSQLVASLQALEDSGVRAYMYRPWIEFNYNNFNGVTEEGRAAFTRVFQQTVQMLIDARLTGFLVTYSPGHKSNTIDRNPGNAYVDVYAATLYSEPELLGAVSGSGCPNYSWYVKTGKPIGFAEYSCRDGVPSECQAQARGSWYTLLQSTMENWSRISWVNGWADNNYSMLDNRQMPEDGNDDGIAFVNSPFTLNLPDVADYRSGVQEAPGLVQLYCAGEQSRRGLEERRYTAQDLKEQGISLTQLRDLRVNEGYCVTFYSGDDLTGTVWQYAEAVKNIPAETAAQFRSCAVAPLENLALEAVAFDADDSSTAWKVNDSIPTVWESRIQTDSGNTWVALEFERPARIFSYTVKSAGYAGRLSMYNVRDFQLQYSPDGKEWTTLNTVVGNTGSQVSHTLRAVTAPYYRLLITGANSATVASERDLVNIVELELYGVYSGERTDRGEDSDTEPADTVWDEETGGDIDGSDSEKTAEDEKPSDGKRRRVVRKITEYSYLWIIPVAVGVVLLGGGIVWFLLWRRKKKQIQTTPTE